MAFVSAELLVIYIEARRFSVWRPDLMMLGYATASQGTSLVSMHCGIFAYPYSGWSELQQQAHCVDFIQDTQSTADRLH